MTEPTLRLDLHYNCAGPVPYPPAIADRPDLGQMPHAQTAMKALGITYRDCEPQPMIDAWTFYGCSNVPEHLPKWLTLVPAIEV